MKNKTWAQRAWVIASPIYCGASRGLFYTQKDQLVIKNKHTNQPKPRLCISYSEDENGYTETLIFNWKWF